MASALATLQNTLKLLSDPVRLRLCALLSRGELAVQELVAITGLQQSRISNHLSLLKRAGVVRDRREGTWSFHSLVEPSLDGPLSPSLYAATVMPWLDSVEGAPDAQALAAVLDQRRKKSREMHDQLADRWPAVGEEFALGTLRAEVLAQPGRAGATSPTSAAAPASWRCGSPNAAPAWSPSTTANACSPPRAAAPATVG